MVIRTRTCMTSRCTAQVTNLFASLEILYLENCATLPANKDNHSASRTLRKHKLADFTIDASLSLQRPTWLFDVHCQLSLARFASNNFGLHQNATGLKLSGDGISGRRQNRVSR